MLEKFDCFGQWISENSRVCNYGCGFSPYMTEEEFKEWVEDGILPPDEGIEVNYDELREKIDYKKLRENCEKCYKLANE